MVLYTPNEAPGSATPSRANIWAEIRKHAQIISIANAAGRTALLASLAALTPPVTPSLASPVWVWRQDTGAIEITTDGSTWRTFLESSDTGWQTLTLGSSWSAVGGYPVQIRRIGKEVTIRGLATFSAGSYSDTICTAPTGYRPTTNCWLPVTLTPTTGHPLVQPLVQSSGVISIPSGYFSGTLAGGDQFALAGSWQID